MAHSKLFAFLAIILALQVLLSMNATALDDDHDGRDDHDDDDHRIPPATAPSIRTLCDEVQCGKGRCVIDAGERLGYKCVCDPGWKRPHDDDDDKDDRKDDDDNNNIDDDDVEFLPCVIPNCSLNYTCQAAPAPVPNKHIPVNSSLFDPCYWTYCGEGTCIKESTYTHRCECKPGFFNLKNVSYFPCYSNCTLGTDCDSLGVRVSNAEGDDRNDGIGRNSGSGGINGNHATSFLPGKFHWMVTLIAMALALRP